MLAPRARIEGVFGSEGALFGLRKKGNNKFQSGFTTHFHSNVFMYLRMRHQPLVVANGEGTKVSKAQFTVMLFRDCPVPVVCVERESENRHEKECV